jgi:LSD1 subclass zinc finger protein
VTDDDREDGAPIAVKPLVCPSCNGAVPLTDGAETKCPYCSARVPIPEEHRALRAALQSRAEQMALVEAEYRRIGKPPGPILRFAAGAAEGSVKVVLAIATGFLSIWAALLGFVWDLIKDIDELWVLLLVLVLPFVALYFVLLGAAHALRALAPVIGVDLIDRYGLVGGFLFLAVLVWFLVPVTIATRDYFDAWADVRRRMQTCLAAKPPKIPGGPAGCRRCGAALEVPPHALGVRCAYCNADNLVALPPRWVANAARASSKLHMQVSSAIAEERTVRKKARGAALAVLGWSLLLLPVSAGFGWLMARLHMFEHREGFGAARDLLPHDCRSNYDDACPSSRDIALHRGETLVIFNRETNEPDPILLRRMGRSTKTNVAFTLDPKTPRDESPFRAVIRAPYTAWWIVQPVSADTEWALYDAKGKLLQHHGAPSGPPSDEPAARGRPACPSGMVPVTGGRHGKDPRVHDFCLDVTEVTVAAYRSCVDNGGCTRAPKDPCDAACQKTLRRFCNANVDGHDEHPINCVDWNQATAFCEKNGKRLPTDVEWKWAAHDGVDDAKYPWGNDALAPTYLNACGPECTPIGKSVGETYKSLYPESDGQMSTSPVGSFPKGINRFGNLDMFGNVWEWSATPEGSKYVYNGGSFLSFDTENFGRLGRVVEPIRNFPDLGFRCAKSR